MALLYRRRPDNTYDSELPRGGTLRPSRPWAPLEFARAPPRLVQRPSRPKPSRPASRLAPPMPLTRCETPVAVHKFRLATQEGRDLRCIDRGPWAYDRPSQLRQAWGPPAGPRRSGNRTTPHSRRTNRSGWPFTAAWVISPAVASEPLLKLAPTIKPWALSLCYQPPVASQNAPQRHPLRRGTMP